MSNSFLGRGIWRKRLAVAACISLSASCGAHAAPLNWDGATAGTWGTNTNWNPDAAPTSADTLTILGPLNVAGALNINVNVAADANTISFTNTAATTLTNTTSGSDKTLTLSSNATAITTGAGLVTIGSVTANQGVNVALGASQTWNVGAGGLVVNSAISGAGFGITKTGTGTLTLGRATNSFNGGIVVDAGNLTSTANGALANNNITFNGAASNFTTSATEATTGGITLNGTLVRLINNNSSFTVGGQVTGTGGFEIEKGGLGSITVNLNATNNDFTGPIRYIHRQQNQNATVNVNSLVDTASPGAGNITFGAAGGAATGLTVSQNFNLGAGAIAPLTLANRQFELATVQITQAINNNSPQPFTINSNLLVSGTTGKALTLGGTGAGLSTFAGNIANNATPNIGTTLVSGLPAVGATSITLASVEGIVIGASVSGTGIQPGTTITSIDPLTRTVTLNSQTTAALAFGATLTIPGVINSVQITKAGTGTWVLNGTNTYTGGTVHNAGTLRLTKLTAMPATGRVSLATGTTLAVNVGGAGEWTTGTSGNGTIGGLLAGLGSQVGATVTYTGAVTLGLDTTNGAASQTYAGNIANVGTTLGINKLGTNALVLTGTNTYTGQTTVSAGTLANGSATAFGSAGIGNGTLALLTTGVFDLNGFNAAVTNVSSSSATSTITNNGTSDATLAISAQANTIGSLVTDGSTNKLAVTLRNPNAGTTPFLLSSPNTFSGGLTLVDGAPLASGTRLAINAAITTVGTPGAITSSPFGTGTITVGQTATDKAGIFFSTVSNDLVNAITINTGLGTDRFGIRSDFNGITLSGLITANVDAVFSSNNAVNTPSISLTNKVTGAGGLAIDLSQTTTANTVLTVTLNSAPGLNDYQGNTVIGRTNVSPAQNYSATLSLGAADQIPNGVGKGNLTLNNNTATRTATLLLNGFNETVNGLNGNGTVDANSGTSILTVGDNNATGNTFSGVIQNSGGTLALTKIGTGTQTLSGANTYAGATTISAGTIIATNGSALGAGATANVSVASGAGLNYSAATDAPLVIGGTLAITGGAGTTIGTSIGAAAASAQITVTGDATISDAAHTVNIYGVSGVPHAVGLVTLLQGTGGGSSLNPTTLPTLGLLYNNTDFTLNLTAGDGGTQPFTRTATTLQVTTVAAPALTSAFWRGGQVTGALNSMAVSNGTTSNWATDAGGTSTNLVPGSTANVFFSTTAGATQQNNVVLGTNMSVNSLTFNDTTPVTIGADGYALTLNSTGSGAASAISVNENATINSDLVLGAGQVWTVASTKSLAVGGTISGLDGMAKDGSGVLTLSGPNTFAGQLSVLNGTLAINTINNTNASGVLGNSALPVILGTTGSTGVLQFTGATASGSKTFTLATDGNGVIQVDNAATNLTISGIIDGSGTLTKTGPGTLTLSGPSTYTGPTTISTGILRLGNVTGLGAGTGAADGTTITAGATLDLGGTAGTASTEQFTVSGTGVGGNGAIISSVAIASPFIGVRHLTLAADTTLGFANRWDVGDINAGGIDALVGAGFTLNFLGTAAAAQASLNHLGETNLGDINVNLGSVTATNILFLQGDTTLGQPAKTVSITGGSMLSVFTNGTLASYDKKFALDNGNIRIERTGATALAGTISLTNANTVTANVAAVAITASNVISGTGSLIKAGAGSLSLTGVNTYLGNTTISAGTLSVDGAGQLGSGTYAGNISNLGTFTYNSTAAQTLSGAISGTGALNKSGASTLTLSGSNAYSGATTVSDGILSLTGSLTGSNVTISGVGVINQSITGSISVANFTHSSTGTSTLAGANTYGGNTTVSAGTLQINGSYAVAGGGTTSQLLVGSGSGTNGNVIIGSGAGTVTFGGNGFANAVQVGVSGGTGTLTINGGTVNLAGTTGTASASLNIGGQVATAAGTGTVTVNGGILNVGQRILMGFNSASSNGTLTIAGGVVNIGTNGTLGYTGNNPGSVQFGAGTTTLNLDGGTLKLFGFKTNNVNNTINFNGGTVTALGNQSFFVGNNGAADTAPSAIGTVTTKVKAGGAIIDTDTFNITIGTALVEDGISTGGGLTKLDSGILTLTGTNTYTGPTTISGGTLQIGNGGASGSIATTSGVTNNAALVFNRSDAQSVGYAISGTGTVTQLGAGTTTLTGANTYMGGTTVTTGILQVGTGGTVGSGNVTNNASFDVARAGLTTAAISGTGTTTVTAASATLTAKSIRQSVLSIGATSQATLTPSLGNKPAGISVFTNTAATSLSIATGGNFDVNDNDLIVYYQAGQGATTLATIQQQIIDGFLGTPGVAKISSSTGAVDMDKFLVAIDNGGIGLTDWEGVTLTGTDQIIAKYTLFGDLNLDGEVNSFDYSVIDSNFGTGNSWLTGDANLDGMVNSFDYSTVDTHFGKSFPMMGGGAGAGLSIAAIPEPSTFVLGGLAVLGLAGYRLRRRGLKTGAC